MIYKTSFKAQNKPRTCTKLAQTLGRISWKFCGYFEPKSGHFPSLTSTTIVKSIIWFVFRNMFSLFSIVSG